MEEERKDDPIIGNLQSYKDKKIPNKIPKPGYNKANENLFKIEPFKEEEKKHH